MELLHLCKGMINSNICANFIHLEYQAMAPDLLRYEYMEALGWAAEYTCLATHGGDLMALLNVNVEEEEKVFVVGHDRGGLLFCFLVVILLCLVLVALSVLGDGVLGGLLCFGRSPAGFRLVS
ncbi:hypothetical protein Q3G72_034250 [Acer saccharum]|nr:hypothetical protein Q3G72_034250 [Acer saccharum]